MPRVKKVLLYKFEELSEEAQKQAIDSCRDWDTDGDWWDATYEDAARIGLKIERSDDYQATGSLIETCRHTINLILAEHGEKCGTYKLAKKYDPLFQVEEVKHACLKETMVPCKDCKGTGIYGTGYGEYREYPCSVCEGTGKILMDWDYEEDETLREEFLKALLREYKNMLDKEYEYLTSDEHIRELLEANDYEFYENGECA